MTLAGGDDEEDGAGGKGSDALSSSGGASSASSTSSTSASSASASGGQGLNAPEILHKLYADVEKDFQDPKKLAGVSSRDFVSAKSDAVGLGGSGSGKDGGGASQVGAVGGLG